MDSRRDGAAGFVQFLFLLILERIERFLICGMIPLGMDLRQSGQVSDLGIETRTASIFIIEHVLSDGLHIL